MNAAAPTLPDVGMTAEQRKELQRVANRLSSATSERDALIVKAYRDGASLREIATLLGVNHVTVRNIIIKQTGRNPDNIR